MNGIKDIPDLISELIDLSKDYLREETFGPARKIGRVAGYSVGAGLSFALGGVLLAVVGMRTVARSLPEGWDWAAYLIAALVSLAVAGGVIGVARR